MKKTRNSTITCLLAILCFVSCSKTVPKLKEGYVIEKWYEPTRTYVTMMPMVVSNGKSSTVIMIPFSITDYADWCLKIRGKYNNEEMIEIIYVSQNQYDSLSLGSHLKLTDDFSVSDNNNHKVRQ